MRNIGKFLGASVVILALIVGVTVYFAMDSAKTPLPGFAQIDAPLVSGDEFKQAGVTTIEIDTHTASMRLRRTDDGWVHATKDDYPVKAGYADDLIERLTLAQILYQKQIEEGEMQRFGLQAVTEPSSSATRVSFRDSQDDILLRVRIGHQMSLPGGSEVETFAALPSKRLITVLDRNLNFPWSAGNWLQPLDLPLSKSDIPRIEIGADADRPQQTFRWTEDGVWLEAGPSGEEDVVKNQSVIEFLVSGLVRLEPEDVRRTDIPADEILWRGSIRLHTEAGTIIDYSIARTEDASWSQVTSQTGDCDNQRLCDLLTRRIDALDGWWLKMPISTSSGIEVASILGSE